MLYNTTNGRAYNNSTTCCITNLPHRNARAQHLDMWRCWDVANFCPLCCLRQQQITITITNVARRKFEVRREPAPQVSKFIERICCCYCCYYYKFQFLFNRPIFLELPQAWTDTPKMNFWELLDCWSMAFTLRRCSCNPTKNDKAPKNNIWTHKISQSRRTVLSIVIVSCGLYRVAQNKKSYRKKSNFSTIDSFLDQSFII